MIGQNANSNLGYHLHMLNLVLYLKHLQLVTLPIHVSMPRVHASEFVIDEIKVSYVGRIVQPKTMGFTVV